MMEGNLSREDLERLYLPPTRFVVVDVPEMKYFMIDGEGSPNAKPLEYAVKWLWAVVHPVRRVAKARMGRTFVEPPLEGLWWSDDPADLIAANKDRLSWRMMIPTAEWVSDEMLVEATLEASTTLGPVPSSLRLGTLHEGPSVQIMHVGPYEQAAEALAHRLHTEFLPAHQLVPNGCHHEIYLTDPSRTAPERMRTVLRQPVREATCSSSTAAL